MGLDWLDPAALQMVRSTLEMQGWHALALLACGLWAPRGGRLVDWAGAAFAVGLLLFCGAVYALALGGVHVAMVAPVGGTLLMVGVGVAGSVGSIGTTQLASLLSRKAGEGREGVPRRHGTVFETAVPSG